MRHRNRALASLMLACVLVAPLASAQVVMGFEAHGGRINLSIGAYPEFVPIPGYPVYYAPDLGRNYFFYDGLYWVYHHDRWYSSDWYDGPWDVVDPFDVPLFVLRIPVRYYADPPAYFGGWDADRAPHWHEYFGRDWAEAHRGWERFDRNRLPPRAPLPDYQRRFSGDRYPSGAERAGLRGEHYRYEPREPASRNFFERQRDQRAPQFRDRRPEEGPRGESERRDERTDDRRQPPDGGRRDEERMTPEGILDLLREERSRERQASPESVPRTQPRPTPESPSMRDERAPVPATRPPTVTPPRAPAPAAPPTAPARPASPTAPAQKPSVKPERPERPESTREEPPRATA